MTYSRHVGERNPAGVYVGLCPSVVTHKFAILVGLVVLARAG